MRKGHWQKVSNIEHLNTFFALIANITLYFYSHNIHLYCLYTMQDEFVADFTILLLEIPRGL
jgi:predicted adenine nucleotide alpha hydrolase (AANH) superfamily ATPase